MTRAKVKDAINAAVAAGCVTGSDLGGALNEVEKAIDELIDEERKAAEKPLLAMIENDAQVHRESLAARFLSTLIEKHDADEFDRAIAGRAVAYADDLIRTLRERKAP